MSKLVFYRQERVDGGIRTGIELNQESIFERFEEGDHDPDPTLLWFVDLRCQGPGLPDDPEAARDWLIENAPIIRAGFLACADELRAGTDPDIYPLFWRGFRDVPLGVEMTIAYTAVRRFDGIRMSEVLRDTADHWEARIRSLESPQPVSLE